MQGWRIPGVDLYPPGLPGIMDKTPQKSLSLFFYPSQAWESILE